MVSPFTLFVARGAAVPVRDRRLNAYGSPRVVVSQNQESATLDQGSLAVKAPAEEPTSFTTSESTEAAEALEAKAPGF